MPSMSMAGELLLSRNSVMRRVESVSKASFDGVEPSWLADGRHLVYSARDRRTSVLCILDTVTGKSTPLTSSFGPAMQASVWTPQ